MADINKQPYTAGDRCNDLSELSSAERHHLRETMADKRPEIHIPVRGEHSGMKVSNTRMIGEARDYDTQASGRQPTTLERIEAVRITNAHNIHLIADRVYQLIKHLDGARVGSGEESCAQEFKSKGKLNDMLDDITSDGNRLAEILADLDHLESLL